MAKLPEIQEEMFFFEGSKGRKLLGFLHLPDAESITAGIIYSHPFAEEKNCSHAIATKTARSFAEHGFAVFRFDYSGCGDSEGELMATTLTDWQDDLRCACAQLKQKANVSKLIYFGLRTGAVLALLEAMKKQHTLMAILWQPVFDLKTFIQQFLRHRLGAEIAARGGNKVTVGELASEIETKGSLEVAGYELSRQLYQSFLNFGKIGIFKPLHFPVLLVSIATTTRPYYKIKNAAMLLQKHTHAFEFEHVAMEPFWDRYWQWDAPELVQLTVNWLKRPHIDQQQQASLANANDF